MDQSHAVEKGFEELKAEHEIENDSDFDATKNRVDQLLSMLWGGRSGWLTGNQIVQEYSRGHILIEPFDASNVNSNSYNYRLAPVLHRLTSSLVDCRKEDDFEVIEFGENGFILMPGELYLGTTIEEFGSTKFASLVTGRSSVGRTLLQIT